MADAEGGCEARSKEAAEAASLLDEQWQATEGLRNEVERLTADHAAAEDRLKAVTSNRTRHSSRVDDQLASQIELAHLEEARARVALEASAPIVSPDGGGAPVMIDDALGWSDPERLQSMGAAIAAAGRECQVIVLTCTPGRYDKVENARSIRLPN